MDTIVRIAVIPALIAYSLFRLIRYFRHPVFRRVTALPSSAGLVLVTSAALSDPCPSANAADRLDRDKLEPAARWVDDLMNLFAGDVSDSAQGLLWLAEIQSGVEQVANAKAAAALRVAQEDIAALLGVMVTEGKGAAAIA